MKEYKTISRIAGPLVFVKKTEPIGFAELVKVTLPSGEIKTGQVLDLFPMWLRLKLSQYSIQKRLRIMCGNGGNFWTTIRT